MNRRSAIAAFFAGMGSITLWPRRSPSAVLPASIDEIVKTPAVSGPCEMVIRVDVDRAQVHKHAKALLHPDFIPDVEGVLGETYFKVGVPPHFPFTKKLYFNGEDVTCRCNECDLVGGWARLMDVDNTGKRIPGRFRTHYGKVEIR